MVGSADTSLALKMKEMPNEKDEGDVVKRQRCTIITSEDGESDIADFITGIYE